MLCLMIWLICDACVWLVQHLHLGKWIQKQYLVILQEKLLCQSSCVEAFQSCVPQETRSSSWWDWDIETCFWQDRPIIVVYLLLRIKNSFRSQCYHVLGVMVHQMFRVTKYISLSYLSHNIFFQMKWHCFRVSQPLLLIFHIPFQLLKCRLQVPVLLLGGEFVSSRLARCRWKPFELFTEESSLASFCCYCQ